MIEVKTLISIAIFLVSIYLFLKNAFRTICDRGILAYLPYNIQHLMLRRSIFDLLCDLWYFSKLKLYLKAIITPLILKPNPKEVSKYLNDIPKQERKVFFIKGIVYALPKNLQVYFFPKEGKFFRNRIYSFLADDDESERQKEN